MSRWPAFLLSAAIPVAFAAGAWAQAQRPVAMPSDLSNHEQAAIALIRMGAIDWTGACAWSLSKDGATEGKMWRACIVRFGIGEPEHPERRQQP